jgi:DNA helicase-2/ATP-dependent DNA helicase PcrA
MNSFDAARSSARRLREQVVSDGRATGDPLALAEAAAAALDYEVSWLPAGDDRLKGAEALIDGQAGIILCNCSGTAGERALRLAHELGHEAVHRLSSIPTGPALKRQVTDYGPRERRELEAEVFAREFLLPLGTAADLHVVQGLTASGIERHLSLPRGIVDRQLLDALLLPRALVPESERPPSPPKPLDPSQQAALSRGEGRFLLEAGPGTGKTRTLVARVGALAARGIDPSTILVLTFSNRAAGEASERIVASLPGDGTRVWTGTFHQFGMDIIHRYHDRIGLPARPVLLDGASAVELLEDLLPTLRLVHLKNLWEPALLLKDVFRAISRAKDELVGPLRYAELGQAMLAAAADDAARAAAQKTLEVARIYEVYQSELRRIGAVDFGDQIMLPALLLDGDREVADRLRVRHRHILVDEYQDVNRASIHLLKSLAGHDGNVWAVGDPFQAIYRFRGASSGSMDRFGSDFGPVDTGRLTTNYRSTGAIVSTFSKFAEEMAVGGGRPRSELTAHRGHGPSQPELVKCADDDAELTSVVAGVTALAADGVAYGNQAVLCRGNAAVDEITHALEASGIPVLRLGNLLERHEVRDLLSLLSLATDTTGSGLIRIGAFPRYRLTLDDVRIVAGALRSSEGRTVLDELGRLATAEGLSDAGREGLENLRKDLAGFSPAMSPWEFLTTYMLERTRWAADIAAAGPGIAAEMRRLAVWNLMEAIRRQPPGGGTPPIRRFLQRLRRVAMLGDARTLGELPDIARALDAVHVMTVHASKGLEFEAVHIFGLTERCFPLAYRPPACPPPPGMIDSLTGLFPSPQEEAAAEEECLFFVGLSRAKTYLRLYSSVRSGGKRPQARRQSPFLSRLAGRLVERQGISGTPKQDREPSVRIGWPDGRPVIEAHHLDLYERCPRRFLLTVVLGIRAARKTTAFDRTHEAISRLVRRLGDPSEMPSVSDLEALRTRFDAEWDDYGPHDHAFSAEYRMLADRMLDALWRLLDGRGHLMPSSSVFSSGSASIIIRSDDTYQVSDGTTAFRRIRTGTDRGVEAIESDLSLMVQMLAMKHEDIASLIEVTHLSDGVVRRFELTERKLENRRQRLDGIMSGISTGHFPIRRDDTACPRCPHWFSCNYLPEGEIQFPAAPQKSAC